MQTPAKFTALLKAALVLLVMALAIWGRAVFSAREHYLIAQSNPPGAEQVEELKRAALFRTFFNKHADAALSDLAKISDSEPGLTAYCDALSGSRHPLWSAAAKCRRPSPALLIKAEAPLSFTGNFLTSVFLVAWVFSTLGFIFKGLSPTGSPSGPYIKWLFASMASFGCWCASLVLF